ncbi:hypothetical protein AMJ85_10305, partial [candidate division BRC1 bacterium SM23_51]
MEEQASTIRQFLELMWGDCENGVFEVRAPNCCKRESNYRFTCSGYFTHDMIDMAGASIIELDRSAIAPGI